jgi:hypothetical protein
MAVGGWRIAMPIRSPKPASPASKRGAIALVPCRALASAVAACAAPVY